MLKYFYILLFILGLSFSSMAHIEDTCKVKIVKIDNKPIIANAIFNAFANKKMYDLCSFCNSHVEFTIFQKEKNFTESGSEVKAMQNLTDILTEIDYVRFKLMNAKAENGEEIIAITAYKYEFTNDYSLNILFILNYNCEINKIILF